MKDKYKVCSLFAGIGGIDLAFQQAGFEIVWANELDSDACKTYRYNFQNTVLTEGDIRKINADDIPDFYILTAGFPCQSFSVCGNRKGFADERGNLFFEIMRIVDAKKPKIIFLKMSLILRNTTMAKPLTAYIMSFPIGIIIYDISLRMHAITEYRNTEREHISLLLKILICVTNSNFRKSNRLKSIYLILSTEV